MSSRASSSGEGLKKDKYKSYKLVVDPAMKQGPQKIYRFDGVLPGVRGRNSLTEMNKKNLCSSGNSYY